MTRLICRTMAAAAVAARLCSTGALAQEAPRTSGGALPRGATGDSGRQAVNLTVDISEAYDQDVTVRSGGADAISLFQGNGFYTLLTPTLDVTSRGDRVQLLLTAGSSARYYSDLQQILATNESAGAGLVARVSSSTLLSLNQSVSHSASPLSGLFASTGGSSVADATGPSSNYSLNTNKSYASATALSVSQQLTRRASFSMNSDLQYTMTGHDATYPDVHSHDVGGFFSYSLNRDLGIKLGYTLRQGQYAGSPSSTQHDFNIGFNYSRPLSKTRRTALAFSLGPTIATAALTTGATDVRRQYRLVGDASLKHQLGRTWTLQGNYHHGIGYIEGFASPVFTGSYSAGASGLLTRRTDLALTAAYSSGESALTGGQDQFTTYTGDARLRFAINRTIAAYVEYVRYYYQFNQHTSLPAGLPPGLTRNGVRTGMTVSFPARRR